MAMVTPKKAFRNPTTARSLHRRRRTPVPAPTIPPRAISSRMVSSQGAEGWRMRKSATAATAIALVPKSYTSGDDRETNAPIWRDVAERLERTRKNWSEVNLSRLSRYAEKGQQIVVPGVVLATGEITTPVTVAAFRTSIAAQKKIEAAGGRAIT